MGKDLKGNTLDTGYSQRIINNHPLYQKRFIYNHQSYDVYGVTLKETKAKYKAKLAELESGVTGEKTTLDNYFDAWITYRHTIGKVKESTLHHYKQLYIKHIKPRFGKRLVNSIQTKEIKQLQIDLAKKYKPKTVNSITDLLHLVFKSLVVEKTIKDNPVVLESLSTANTPKRTNNRSLSKEEQALFIEQAKVSYYYNAIRLLFATGMRSGELRGLRWSDYDKDYTWANGEKGAIHIRRTASIDLDNKLTMNTPKTKKSKRTLACNAIIREILENQRKQQIDLGYLPTEESYMFTSTRGLVISRTMLKKAFENISLGLQRKGYDFEPISPHACRHSFITQKLYEGENPYAVKAYVGHDMKATVTESVYAGIDENEVTAMITRHDQATVIPLHKEA